MKEQWRPVVGFEGRYSVSDQGRVRREARDHGAVVGRILRTSPDGRPARDGRTYRKVSLYKQGGYKRRERIFHKKVAHLVLEAFVGPRPPNHDADHIGARDDNRLVMLRWRHRRSNRGATKEPGANRSLAPRTVRAIRRAWRDEPDTTQEAIARRFKTTRGVVAQILTGKTYGGAAYQL